MLGSTRTWSPSKALPSPSWKKWKPLPPFWPFVRKSNSSLRIIRGADGLLGNTTQPAGSEGQFTGKRYALLIAIGNYKDPEMYEHLPGAHQDIELLKAILIGAFGFQEDEIVVMSDELEEASPLYPNHANMTQVIQEFGACLKKGDLGFFGYSGHVAQLDEYAEAERDGKDEAIVPADSTGKRDTLILDDDLNAWLVAPLPEGSTLLVVCDACHSETILDLPWKYVIRDEARVLGSSPASGDTTVPPPLTPGKSPLKIIKAHKKYKGGKGFVLCLSACRDDQDGFEVKNTETGELNGALTFLLHLLFQNRIGPNATNNSTNMTIPSVKDILVELRRMYKERGRGERIQITTSMQLPNPLFSVQEPNTISGWRIRYKQLWCILTFSLKLRFSKFLLS